VTVNGLEWLIISIIQSMNIVDSSGFGLYKLLTNQAVGIVPILA